MLVHAVTLKITKDIMQLAYCVHGFSSWTRQTHTSSQSVWADLFLVTVCHRLAVFHLCSHNSSSHKITHTKHSLMKKVFVVQAAPLPLCLSFPKMCRVFVYLYVHLPTHIRWLMCSSCVYPGKTMDCSATLAALQEAKELVKAFGKSSSRVPSAISVMDSIFNKLQQVS